MPTNSNINNTIPQLITQTLETNYMPYAMSVIVSRAIPEIDGFKPSHRKLLYTMFKMGLLAGNRIKSADVVGQTMRLNPHGDGAIYETLVRLTRGNGALLHPFIDSKGNFGKQYSRDMAYAASRYTEVKLDSICSEVFKDIDKNTVEFVDNYNGSMKEPLLFPTTFPNLLVTPNQGIAVGMASNICSFNLKEVCQATIAFIKNPDCYLLDYLKAPDFSTGGQLLYNKKELEQIYKTGKGGFKVRSKYRFDKKNSCIEISEIPYTTTVEVIIDKIIALIKAGKIKEITDVRDETDLSGLKLTIDIKRNVDPDILMHRLYGLTTLSDSFSCNFNILINETPHTMGIAEILDEWIKFRMNCIKRQISYDIEKKSEKLHLLDGLSKILLNINKAIKIIRNTEQDKLVITNLCSGFKIDERQAEFIAEIKLRNLNKEHLLNRVNERDSLRNEIAELKASLEDDKKVHMIIIRQLKDVSKKFGKPRLTEIISAAEVSIISQDELIEDYGIKLFLTEHNYFKKIPLVSLRSASEQNLKSDDVIVQELETTNKSDILMFSNRCNVYKCRAYELSDCKASSLGEYLNNILELDGDERIIHMVATTDYKGFMIFIFENGKIAKIAMDAYSTKVNRKKLLNAYSNKAPLIFLEYIPEDKDYLLISGSNKASLISSGLLAPISTKNSAGIQAYNLKKNSSITHVFSKEDFQSDNIEYYRTKKIPSTNHFITDSDKNKNQLDIQLKLT